VGAVLVVGVALSQFFWVPPLLRGTGSSRAPGAWHGLPVAGLTVGPPDARLRVEEFTDFECPHCGRAHQVMMDVLRRHPGKIHLVHRDFPLDMSCNPLVKREFHPNACRAALYARCAARQDLYWPYEELLFENREQLDERNLRALARQVGLDLPRLERCLEDPRTLESLQSDINEGLRRGITGTPTLFVNGDKHVGMQPLSFWEEKLRR
jgi:protein-disulfide isomerase